MRTIEKKIWPFHFSEIASGKKKFDLRKNDFDINPGDVLTLREFNPCTETYTGREVKLAVTYVLAAGKSSLPFFNPWDSLDQFQIIGFDEVKNG